MNHTGCTTCASKPPATYTLLPGLRNWDTWAVTPACMDEPKATNSISDSFQRLWGWNSRTRTSCTYKDEQQQPLYVGSAPAKQEFKAAPSCMEPPSAANSAQDSQGRLWGVRSGRCVLIEMVLHQDAHPH